jgi:hypothetical protein
VRATSKGGRGYQCNVRFSVKADMQLNKRMEHVSTTGWLLIFWVGQYNAGAPAVATFHDQAACEAAQKQLEAKFNQWAGPKARGVCVAQTLNEK